jgi:hypothetical protein
MLDVERVSVPASGRGSDAQPLRMPSRRLGPDRLCPTEVSLGGAGHDLLTAISLLDQSTLLRQRRARTGVDIQNQVVL